MHLIEVEDLIDELTYYLKLTREGDHIVVEEGEGRG